MSDKRRAAIGEATTSCYALRFLRRFATGILEIGSRSEWNVARIDKRVARNVGMSDKKRAPIGSRQGTHHVPTRMTRIGTSGESRSATVIRIETTASPYGLRFVRRCATRCLKSEEREQAGRPRTGLFVVEEPQFLRPIAW